MKTKVFVLLFFLGLIWSCTQEYYDQGDGDFSLMRADMVIAHTNAQKQVDNFVTDDGEVVTLATPTAVSWMKTPDSIYRAVFYYSRSSEGVTLNASARVGVVTPKHIDDLKTHPVDFESIWLSKDKLFLNLMLSLKLGSTDDEKAIHTLGCHIDTLMHNADSTKTMFLRLYHDQSTVPEYYSQRTYLSIPLSIVDADSVEINIASYKGNVVKRFSIR